MTKSSMQVVSVQRSEGPLRLKERPRPEPGASEALVRIAASGVNPLDLKIRAGAAAHAKHPLPAVLGIDLAGVVEAVGPGVRRFAPGDEVYGMTGGVGGVQGTLAQYAVADADLLARKPDILSMREAAALPLIVISAWEGLVDQARVSAGRKVLVQGGAGGVGHVAVQIAKAFGAEVFATHRGAHAEVLRDFGAEPIDSTVEVPEAYVARLTGGRGFDVVYDTVDGAVLDASFAAVARFGHVVSCLGWGTHALAPLSLKNATYFGVFTLAPLLTGENCARHGAILTEAAKLVEIGLLTPRLDGRVFTLETAEAAHAAVRDGQAAGKIVVSVA